MKVLELIEEFENKLEESSAIPFSGKVLIDKSEITSLLQEIQLLLPDEMKHAKWIKEERNKIIEEAKKEAEEILRSAVTEEKAILSGAKNQFESMVDNAQVMEMANEKAEAILHQARIDAEEIKEGAYFYADDLFARLGKQLESLKIQVSADHKELKGYINK